MNSKFSVVFPVATILVTALLAGCAAGPATPFGAHRSGPIASHDAMGMGADGMGMSGSNMASMCDMHEKMLSEKSPEERKAMMVEHMKTMSPEMMQRHMALMQSEMQMMRERMGTATPGK